MGSIFVIGARGIPDVEGGVEKAVERIFPIIAAQGWSVTVGGLKKFIDRENYKGVDLWAAPTSKIFGTDKLLYYIFAVFHAARIKPDIVYLAGLGSALFLFAYRFLDCKIIVRYGSADYILEKWGLIGRLGFRLAEFQLRYADMVAVVSPSLGKRLSKKTSIRNLVIIPNAVDEPVREPELTVERGKSYILAVGRVTHQKNLRNLLEAFRIFRESHPDTNLLIAGNTNDRRYVAKLHPLPEGAELIGYLPRTKLEGLYANAALFVHCSIHEGHSNAILEAIGSNCPILLSDIPENRDFKLSSKQYFDPAQPGSIASAMTRALIRPDQYRVATDGLQRWTHIAEQTAKICDILVAENSQSWSSQSIHETT